MVRRALRRLSEGVAGRQVGDGQGEFVPSPAEGRALIASGYRTPFTLLVRFENDAIDETPAVAGVLQRSNPAGAPLPRLSPLGRTAASVPLNEGQSCNSRIVAMAVSRYAPGTPRLVQRAIHLRVGSFAAWLHSCLGAGRHAVVAGDVTGGKVRGMLLTTVRIKPAGRRWRRGACIGPCRVGAGRRDDVAPPAARLTPWGPGRAGTTTVTLPGTHLTPCGADVALPPRGNFAAVDLLAAGARAVAQADIRRLAARMVAWLDSRR